MLRVVRIRHEHQEEQRHKKGPKLSLGKLRMDERDERDARVELSLCRNLTDPPTQLLMSFEYIH